MCVVWAAAGGRKAVHSGGVVGMPHPQSQPNLHVHRAALRSRAPDVRAHRGAAEGPGATLQPSAAPYVAARQEERLLLEGELSTPDSAVTSSNWFNK